MDEDNDIGDVLAAIFAHMQGIKKSGLVEEIIDDANASTELSIQEEKQRGVDNPFGSGENH